MDMRQRYASLPIRMASDLSIPPRMRVMIALCAFVDPRDGLSYPTVATLMELCRLKRSMVYHHLNAWKKAGYLTDVTRQTRIAKRKPGGQVRVYRIDFQPVPLSQTEPPYSVRDYRTESEDSFRQADRTESEDSFRQADQTESEDSFRQADRNASSIVNAGMNGAMSRFFAAEHPQRENTHREENTQSPSIKNSLDVHTLWNLTADEMRKRLSESQYEALVRGGQLILHGGQLILKARTSDAARALRARHHALICDLIARHFEEPPELIIQGPRGDDL